MSNQAASVIPIGTIIGGKYRVERYVGDGGMGQVVAGRHLVLNELYAIKLMHHRDLANPQAGARFIREAQAVVKLKNSEHVARVHDVGKLESGDLYIVMELLVGQDLGDVLKTRGVLPVHEACSYVLQACSALAEAHEFGIIHRDLKPANLFLTYRKDGSPCVKVLDFGISKVLDGVTEGAEIEMTGTRQMMGSPLYMSPEQAKSARDVDARTDIWALGAILYKLLTGKAPFSGQTVAEVSFALLEPTSVRPPSEIRRDISPQLDACIMRCLEKNVHRRYGRVKDLMAALTPFASPPIVPANSPALEEEDAAATVLVPVGKSGSNSEGFGGTIPLSAADLASIQSGAAASARRREKSSTEVMPGAYRQAAPPNEKRSQQEPNQAHAQTTQPLDGAALRAAIRAQRSRTEKSPFTDRVRLEPVTTTPNPALVPQAPLARSNALPSPIRVTGHSQIPAIMPPPIPPAYPTGAYALAPAARTTLQPLTTPPVEVPAPSGSQTRAPAWRSGDSRRIAAIALLTIVIGAPIVVLALRVSNGAAKEAAAKSPSSSASGPYASVASARGSSSAPGAMTKPATKESRK